MSNHNQFTRRRLLKTAGGLALVSGVSAPAILRAQTADVIKIGHLTPRTGMMETPSTSAAARSDSFSPGASRPEIRRSASFA